MENSERVRGHFRVIPGRKRRKWIKPYIRAKQGPRKEDDADE